MDFQVLARAAQFVEQAVLRCRAIDQHQRIDVGDFLGLFGVNIQKPDAVLANARQIMVGGEDHAQPAQAAVGFAPVAAGGQVGRGLAQLGDKLHLPAGAGQVLGRQHALARAQRVHHHHFAAFAFAQGLGQAQHVAAGINPGLGAAGHVRPVPARRLQWRPAVFEVCGAGGHNHRVVAGLGEQFHRGFAFAVNLDVGVAQLRDQPARSV